MADAISRKRYERGIVGSLCFPLTHASISSLSQVQNVQAAGAIAAIVYNNNPGLVNPSINDPTIRIQCGGISNEQGESLFNMTMANPGVQFQLPNEDVQFEIPTAGKRLPSLCENTHTQHCI